MSIFTRSIIAGCALLTISLLTGSCDSVPPAVPENLNVYPDSPRAMIVTWDFDVYGGDLLEDFEFRIYRDDYYVGDTWAELFFVDYGLEPATEYCYRVSSVYSDPFSDDEGPKSSMVCAETYPLNSLSGAITLQGKGVEGVSLTLASTYPAWGTYHLLTDPAGNYLFKELENGNYLLTPSKPGYTFSPGEVSLRVLNGERAIVDFWASYE